MCPSAGSPSAARRACGSPRTRPSRIDRLVLACTSARFGRARAVAGARAGRPRRGHRARSSTGSSSAGSQPTSPTSGLRSWPASAACSWRRRPRATRAGARPSPPGTSAGGSARSVRPTLVVVGADDPATPPEHGSFLSERIAGAALAVLPAAAHLANVQQPESFAALVTRHSPFRKSHEGPATRRACGSAARCSATSTSTLRSQRTTDDTADFQDLITRYAWGEIWARPGLDRRTRSAITLMALVAQNREHELAMHIRAALRNGLTPRRRSRRCCSRARSTAGCPPPTPRSRSSRRS